MNFDGIPTARMGLKVFTCRVKIRRGEGWPVKPEADQIDGVVHQFRTGWRIGPDDHDRYVGEVAMLPADLREWLRLYPGAPTWIASGDLDLEPPVGEPPIPT